MNRSSHRYVLIVAVLVLIITTICYIIGHGSDKQVISLPQKYTDSEYHFSINYPENFAENSFPNPAGSGEIVLLQPSVISPTSTSQEGMQISIKPFSGTGVTQLTVAEIKQSLPNLALVSPADVVVGGLGDGVSFIDGTASSSNRQIWFIAGKNIYQVTAPASFDATAQDMMNTWKFTK